MSAFTLFYLVAWAVGVVSLVSAWKQMRGGAR